MVPGEITALLRAHREGTPGALEQVIALAYEALLDIASRHRRRHRTPADTSSLAHATISRLMTERQPDWQNSGHFLAVFAHTMHRVVIDGIRQRASQKRGGDVPHVELDAAGGEAADDDLERVVIVHEALERMTEFNERMARVVECRLFGGLSEEETSAALELPLRTVQRDWQRGRAWLRLALE